MTDPITDHEMHTQLVDPKLNNAQQPMLPGGVFQRVEEGGAGPWRMIVRGSMPARERVRAKDQPTPAKARKTTAATKGRLGFIRCEAVARAEVEDGGGDGQAGRAIADAEAAEVAVRGAQAGAAGGGVAGHEVLDHPREAEEGADVWDEAGRGRS